MKILQIIWINLLLSAYLFSSDSYCIQLKSMVEFSEKNLSSASKSILQNYEKARIEKRGVYYILRVGEYLHYVDASNDFKVLRKVFKGAYVRVCNYDELNVIYPLRKVPKKNVVSEPCFTPMYLELEKENNKTLKEHKGDYSESLYPKIETNTIK